MENNYYPFARLAKNVFDNCYMAIIDVILAKGYKVNEVIDLSLTYYQKGAKNINVYTHVLEMGNEWYMACINYIRLVNNEFGGISLELSTDEPTDDNNTDVLTWFDASKLEIKEDIFKLYEVLFNHLVSSDYKVIR